MAYEEQVRYQNQKRIVIEKEQIKNGDIYLRVKKDVLERAAQRLDAGPFKLYIYLASNKDGYGFNLSQVAVERSFGMKKNQYYLAISKLKDAGYLIQPDPMIDNYIFIERGPDPIDEEQAFPIEERTSFPKKESGLFPNREGSEFPNKEIPTFPKREIDIPPNSVEAKIAEDIANYPFINKNGKLHFRW